MKRVLLAFHSLHSAQRSMCSGMIANPAAPTYRLLSRQQGNSNNLLELCGVSIYDPSLAISLGCERASRCGSIEEDDSLVLQRSSSDNALQLVYGLKNTIKERPFCIDFNSPTFKKRIKEARTELVYKAVGSFPNKGGGIVVDLTAGLGRDSMVLAACGYSVVMCERNPVLHLLLQDALERLHRADGGKSSSSLASRVRLLNYDSNTPRDSPDALCRQTIIDMLSSSQSSPVSRDGSKPIIHVYLDPMYAPNSVGKKSLVKKDTQMLHRLVGDSEGNNEDNNRALFATAVAIAGGGKVVVKRAVNAPPLAAALGYRTAEITGSTQRFDVIYPP